MRMTQKSINYAEVLYRLNVEEQVVLDTENIIRENPELHDVLVSPVVSRRDKIKVIDRIFPQEAKNFLKVLCENDGIDQIYDICDEYIKHRKVKNDILLATLYYVSPPTEEQKRGIENFLLKTYDKKAVELHMEKKEDLIGGFVIKTGDREYDWSLAGRCNLLKQRLVTR
jgi:F-type H+-transporting ATPase subunit delta